MIFFLVTFSFVQKLQKQRYNSQKQTHGVFTLLTEQS